MWWMRLAGFYMIREMPVFLPFFFFFFSSSISPSVFIATVRRMGSP